MTVTEEVGPDTQLDALVLAGRPITSRLIMGTGGAANLDHILLEGSIRSAPAPGQPWPPGALRVASPSGKEPKRMDVAKPKLP